MVLKEGKEKAWTEATRKSAVKALCMVVKVVILKIQRREERGCIRGSEGYERYMHFYSGMYQMVSIRLIVITFVFARLTIVLD